MTIRFQCPNCQVVRAVNPRLLGREIKCPDCGAPVQVPSAEQIEHARRDKQRAVDEEREQRTALNRILAQPRAVMVEEQEPDDEEDAEAQLSAEERRLAEATTNFVRPKPTTGEDMDMTPMVDVTFLLLIFFMITASFSVQKSIQRPAQRQEDPSTRAVETPPDENPDIVTVQVDEFNAYNIITSDWDRAAGSKQDLIVALNDAHAGDASGHQPTKLVVQAHEDCMHASVIAALDAGREAQFENFQVNTVEQFD
jgi:biopolymer transport protein ExbD